LLHALQKKSKHGITTPKPAMDLIEKRPTRSEFAASGKGGPAVTSLFPGVLVIGEANALSPRRNAAPDYESSNVARK
jgi:hypothetical protein